MTGTRSTVWKAVPAMALALAALLSTAPAAAGEFPDAWYYYGAGRPAPLQQMEGKPAPELQLQNWIGDPQSLDALRGKVVVIDFWATWCPPCMAAIPKNVQLAEKYRDKGVVFIGVHDSKRGSDRMGATAERLKINYPLGVDSGASAHLWNVRFWPTYSVVDQKGVVRAAGLLPDKVEDVLKALVGDAAGDAPQDQQSPASASDGVSPQWLEGNPQRRQRLAPLLTGTSLPPIESPTWINSQPLELDGLRGKVVLLDFWATWCVPCRAMVPKLNDLHRKYADKGLVIIGVCHPRQVERMPQLVDDLEIVYPVCADPDGEMIRQWKVDGYPDYYVIDRDGALRVADCANQHIEAAVKAMLAE